MKLLSLLVLAVTALGCEQHASQLDHGKPTVGAAGGDHETRLRRIEENLARREEALQMLDKAWAAQKAEAEKEAESEPDPDAIFAVDIARDVEMGLVDGPATAPVTIVKAFDFACPYCQQVNTTLEELVKQYNGKLRVVYKNFVVHPEAAMAGHLASCAAAKQGKYLAFKDAFWDQAFTPFAQSGGRDAESMGLASIKQIAGGVGLDVARLETDMRSEACTTLIREDMTELEKFKVAATPTLFINGTHIGGALPKAALQQIIDEKLKIAEASGVPAGEYYAREILGKGEKQFRSAKDAKKATN